MNLYVFTNGWYLIELGAPRENIAIVWAIFFLPGTFLIFFSKKLIVIGRLKRAIVALETLKAATLLSAFFIFRYSQNYLSVYVVSGVLGMFFVPFYPLTYTFLKELFKDKSIVKFSNLSEVSFQVSGAVALFISGFIIKKFGFQGVVLLSTICLFASSFLMVLIEEPGASILKAKEAVSSGGSKIRISNLKLVFGFFHLVPQVVILLLNIPTLVYVEQVMGAGPIEYGILDSVTALSGMLVSIVWTYYSSVSSRLSAFTFVGLGSVFILFLISLYSPSHNYFPYFAFALLGGFLISFKMMSRAQLMINHTADDVAVYGLRYQTFANFCLVAGAFGMASLLRSDNGQKSFAILSAVTFSFLALILFLLLKMRKVESSLILSRK